MSQNLKALARAQEVRISRAVIKRRLAAGELSLDDALKLGDVQGMKIGKLLSALPRFGPYKVSKALREAGVLESRRVENLTSRQRDALIEASEHRRDPPLRAAVEPGGKNVRRMTNATNRRLLRVYEPHELGPDGYPPEWHRASEAQLAELGIDVMELDGPYGIKHLIRDAAEGRCVRCMHPYRSETAGERGEWSPCDERCAHGGPMRIWGMPEPGIYGWQDLDLTPENCGRYIRECREVQPLAIEARWRILTVHHLDINKANCRWWNLAALCQRCHLQIQGKVQMARVWPWEHSEWFRPYVAGYYASVYLGEDLDRPTVESRVEELLDLERATA